MNARSTAYLERRRRDVNAAFAAGPLNLEVGAEHNVAHEGARGGHGFPLCEEAGCRREAIGPFDYACVLHWESS